MKHQTKARGFRTIPFVMAAVLLLGSVSVSAGQHREISHSPEVFLDSGSRNADPDLEKAEKENQIRLDYLQKLKETHPDDSAYQDLMPEDIVIWDHFGEFSGYDVVTMDIRDSLHDAAIESVEVAGYLFTFPTTQTCDRTFAYKDGSFVHFKEAYETGLLTKEDVHQIAVVREARYPGSTRRINKEEQIRLDYLQYLIKKHPGDSGYQNLTWNHHIHIEKAYGHFSGYDLLSMAAVDPEDDIITSVEIAGYLFAFPSTQACDRIFAYKDGSFVHFKEAYETGLLTKEDVHQIAVLREERNPADEFTDIHEGDWYYEAVRYCVVQKLFSGVSDTLFSPNTPMTRGMFVTVLSKLADNLEIERSDHTCTFEDVPAGAWYEQAVAWAAGCGIVSGYDAQTFGPNDPVTREQMMVMLMKFAETMAISVPPQGDSVEFTDHASIHSWAKDAVDRASRAKLISGYPDGTLRPQGTATRAEVASLFRLFSEKSA